MSCGSLFVIDRELFLLRTLKYCIFIKVEVLRIAAYYKEYISGHGIFNLLKLNSPNNNSRKEKRPCPKEIIAGK
jgi:hypothetical protein